MDKDIFVQNVEILCLRKGVKPTNACKESGVGGSFLSDIKRGRDPSTKKVQLLAQYLGCTVSDLLGGQPSAQTEPQNAYDPASEMMQKALPVIGAIAQSGQNAVKPEKRALLGALKPFVAEEVSGQFDRALRLVSMARMARAALGQVNLSADDTAPRAL